MNNAGLKFTALLLALSGLTATACTTTGAGVGTSPTGAVTAALTWKASDAQSGTMTAMLSTGETYSGRFFQITQETRVDQLQPLWVGWGRRWRGWDYWGPNPAFATQYTGKVVANLDGPNGAHMRCRFDLVRPSQGMAGGGEGRCQLPNGATIDATFPPA